MKLRLYADTSVIGGVYDAEFTEWSSKLIREFKDGKNKAVISDLTLKEIEEAPKQVKDIINGIPRSNIEFVALNEDAKSLARSYIKEKVVSTKYIIDAQHIAMATVYQVDVLVSWNFKHIVNLERIRQYNAVNLKSGYRMIEIRSPREVLHER